MEITATILGLVQGILVMLNRRSNWIFYIFQMLFLIIFSSINHLYGDVVNNSFYLILGFIGFLEWSKNKKSSNIGRATNDERIKYIVIIVMGTMVLNVFLKATNDPLPLLDSFTTISSLVATYYMIRKKNRYLDYLVYKRCVLCNRVFYVTKTGIIFVLIKYSLGGYGNRILL